ncbi:hypothetical protein CYMTET_29498 [Cymbomonas tetramitiformis]|uniref:Uncharacterized protein n=1 Tax=Cymbomonas tetramitiformis TaxID=36881 RepID=A0AAE0FKZ2_9CHLO|nr:hypothetical protein CYMTET_29498 [Cymbomonas tetramitiformis]
MVMIEGLEDLEDGWECTQHEALEKVKNLHLIEIAHTDDAKWGPKLLGKYTKYGPLLQLLRRHGFRAKLHVFVVGRTAGLGGASGGGMPAEGAQPTAVPPPDYWRPEGYYGGDHNPGHGWTWYPGPSYPQVVVPDWDPPSPGGAPPSTDYEAEEVEQPTLNEDHGSARGGGFYIDDRYGVDITAPLYRAGNDNIADIFTRPLHPQAIFCDNPSYYGLELQSEDSSDDSGYGSGMDEVD